MLDCVVLDEGVGKISLFQGETMKLLAILFFVLAVFSISGQAATEIAPYRDIANGTANWGSSGGDREFITIYNAMRVRETGTITNVSFRVIDNADFGYFRLTVWRLNGSNYDRIAVSENLNSYINRTPLTTVYINLSVPLSVQEGDYYGYKFQTSSYAFYAISDANGKTYYVNSNLSDAVANNYNWTANSSAASYLPIELYTPTVDTVFIGDSIIAGHPAHYSYIENTKTDSINSTIERHFFNISSLTYQNMGIGSQTTTNIKNRFVADVVNLTPSYAIIEGGVNDVSGGTANATILSNWEMMLNNSENHSIVPLSLLILPWTNGNNAQNSQIDYLNSIISQNTTNHGGKVIDARCYVGTFRVGGSSNNCWDIQTQYNSGDNVHFNSAGHQKIAEAIWNQGFLEDTETASNGMYNYSRYFIGNGSGWINYTITNTTFINAPVKGSATLISDNVNATLNYSYPNINISLGFTDHGNYSYDVGIPYNYYDLSGTVNNTLGAPINDALMTWDSSTTYTNESGYYEFLNVSGTHDLLTQQIGYADNRTTLTLTGDTTVNITLQEKDWMNDIITYSMTGALFGGVLTFLLIRKKKRRYERI